MYICTLQNYHKYLIVVDKQNQKSSHKILYTEKMCEETNLI